MSTSITYFVHGTTTDNERDLATGWLPGILSVVGRKQAQDLGSLVSKRKFDVVFCSDLQRAVDSANLGFGANYQIILDKRLRECNYGDLTSTTATKFKNRLTEYVDRPFPHGESYLDVENRLREFLKFIKANYDGQSIALVAHQAPQLALEVILKQRTWQQAIEEDWRKTKGWKPGWEYTLN